MKALFFAVALSLIFVNSIAQTPSFVIKPQPDSSPVKPEVHNEKLEKAVYAAVQDIPEAKKFLSRINKDDPHDLWIDGEPDKDFKYYVVKMGLSGKDMFRTACRFCVDPKTLKVYYWDVMADDMSFSDSAIISLSYWRQIRNTPGWQKRHTYKHGKLVVLAD